MGGRVCYARVGDSPGTASSSMMIKCSEPRKASPSTLRICPMAATSSSHDSGPGYLGFGIVIIIVQSSFTEAVLKVIETSKIDPRLPLDSQLRFIHQARFKRLVPCPG